ncbi:hypothetical protein [Acidiphilium sp. PM]|uniref:hypothetical protein n=1 Tax=Acidiphilium sp. PM TaxID=1043206 RepID=UPI0005870AD2|nr:hypothetical protein [Acidiphilium sp. PM]
MITDVKPVVHFLSETPKFAELTERGGMPCRVWLDPSSVEFVTALRKASDAEVTGLRGLLTEKALYVWQSANLLHMDFERLTGTEGMRLGLRANEIQVNDETVAQPAYFPWVFRDHSAAISSDIEDRRRLVERFLMLNTKVKTIYPDVFRILWYA